MPLQLDPGGACFVPARWAHWLDHPCDGASVTFDVGFYTRNDLRARKVYDVNWLMRKAHLSPGGPVVASTASSACRSMGSAP